MPLSVYLECQSEKPASKDFIARGWVLKREESEVGITVGEGWGQAWEQSAGHRDFTSNRE